MTLFNCFILVLIAVEIRGAAIAFQDAEDGLYPVVLPSIRERRSPFPGRAMMFHGYFGSAGHPYQGTYNGHDRHNGRSYDPQGAMTAFAAGDSVSAGSSYYGNGGGYDCSNCGANKPANGNGNGKKDDNGHSNGNGNGYPVNGNGHPVNGNGHPANGNGNGFHHHHHEEPADVPAGNGKPENGEEPQPVPEPTAAYPNGNGNGNGADNEVPQEAGSDEGYLGDQPAAEETPKGETLPPAEPTQAAAAPETPKKFPDDSDEEEDEPSFFSHKGRGRGPYYNSYFPMVFGAFPGYGGGRGGNREEGGHYNPGVATAIANSFSTGRGAVATSHATAYGGPQLVPSGYRKNGSRTRNQS